MKKIVCLIALLSLTSTSFAADAVVPTQQPSVLSSVSGNFVLGSVETVRGGVVSKDVYLLDTKTGQVWFQGCIANGSDGKCDQLGLRPLRVSDGRGGQIFESIKEAAEYKPPKLNEFFNDSKKK